MSYSFESIEKKWQDFWEKENVFASSLDQSKPKYYVLDMFPYPSGAGLHVGHPEGYTATDIVSRFKIMQGYNVLHPMGWDAFGLPAERYAMKTGIHPAETTKQNINNFRRQLKALGFAYDWSREINTTDEQYYKYTQWIFLLLFNSYFDGKKARSIDELSIPENIKNNPVEIEKYRDSKRLAYIAQMPVNWCEELGTVLANEEVSEWTEKGYSVEQKPMRQWMLRITEYADRLLKDLDQVNWPKGTLELQRNWIGKSDGAEIKFFFEDASIDVFTTRPDTLMGATYLVLAPEHPLVEKLTISEQADTVFDYISQAKQKTELERQLEAGENTKSGVFTGSFVNHPISNSQLPVYIADYVLMSYGSGAIMAVPAHDSRDYAFANQQSIDIKRVITSTSGKEGELPFTEEGILINSGEFDNLSSKEAKAAIIELLQKKGLGKSKVTYRLRDWLFSRQRYWGEPIPISFTENETKVQETVDSLPLLLPESSEFKPGKTGESPLANLDDWLYWEHLEYGKMRRETNTMPQWAGSCWYYLRFADPENENDFISQEAEAYWLGDSGVDLYVGGAEHAVLHLLYARFWHKVLYDHGYVTSPEPFKRLIHQGIILGEDGTKMSKSRGNVINPDDIIKDYGADAFRLYEMFMGPLEQMKPWSTKAIEGVARFLQKMARFYLSEDGSLKPGLFNEPEGENKEVVERIIHQSIKKLSESIDKLQLNTCISQLMICLNKFTSVGEIGKNNAKIFVQLVSPFAPHLCEEIWQQLGSEDSIIRSKWPTFDPEKAKENEVEIVFQVSGKVRGKGMFSPEVSKEELEQAALNDSGVRKFLIEGKEPRKVIVVKGRLVSIVP
jgi:leucyl-tRNA synthetase